MNQTFVKSVTEQLPQLGLLQDEPMKKHTTFRIGGSADYYAEPDMSQISKLIEMAKACDMPVTVIGNGSNLLVGDKGIRGLVIGIGKGLSEIDVTEAVAQQSTAQDFTAQDNGHIITAGAGAILAAVAAKAAEASLSGLEFASGIPGSVGGAVVMNAGAYGGEIKRVEKQPLEYPSAGSTFKRPEGYFAGKLIMDAGLRGYSVGDAQVSQKHCGFVVNKGEATAADVLTLIKDVQETGS